MFYCEKDNILFSERFIFSSDCIDIKDNENFYSYSFRCPNITCNEKLITVDNNVALPLLIINKKGYKAHIHAQARELNFTAEIGIVFEEKYFFQTLPHGFKYIFNDIVKNKYVIYKNNEDDDRIKMQYKLLEASCQLAAWAIELPDNTSAEYTEKECV